MLCLSLPTLGLQFSKIPTIRRCAKLRSRFCQTSSYQFGVKKGRRVAIPGDKQPESSRNWFLKYFFCSLLIIALCFLKC